MLRRIALSLGLLVSVAVMLPLASSTAHNLRFQFAPGHRFHHHSHAWWRRHRALLRRRQAMLARRRALMAASRNGAMSAALPRLSDNHSVSTALALPELPSRSDLAMPLPNGWLISSNVNGVETFRVAAAAGMSEAHASLAVVALASTNTNQILGREQRNSLGGVSFADLRRNVIDKMISAGGWVVNDRQREFGGHRVFEVIAQTPGTKDGKPDQVWNFYFTEINGRIYSLTTHVETGATERLANDAEKFLSTFSPLEAKAKRN